MSKNTFLKEFSNSTDDKLNTNTEESVATTPDTDPEIAPVGNPPGGPTTPK